MFGTHWRWNATIALAVPRSRGGRKVPPQIQRMEAEDLLAAAFPDAAACLENIPGDREIPDHPLVRQTIDDCLHEVMDLDRPRSPCCARIHAGEIRCIARDLPEPSPLAHEILNAKPYAFLDDAPLEERRTQAVYTRRAFEPSSADDLGALDPAAIERVRDEAWPEVRDADELHDALLTSGFLTEAEGGAGRDGRPGRLLVEELVARPGVRPRSTAAALGRAPSGCRALAAGRHRPARTRRSASCSAGGSASSARSPRRQLAAPLGVLEAGGRGRAGRARGRGRGAAGRFTPGTRTRPASWSGATAGCWPGSTATRSTGSAPRSSR